MLKCRREMTFRYDVLVKYDLMRDVTINLLH
jgi:hypothetical protein